MQEGRKGVRRESGEAKKRRVGKRGAGGGVGAHSIWMRKEGVIQRGGAQKP